MKIKSISITDEQAKWVEDEEKNLSRVVQRLLREEIEKDD